MPSKAIPWLKVVTHLLCLLPLAHLAMMYRSGSLAAEVDPVAFLTHFTGNWALWLLLTDLAITPGRRLSPRLAWLVRFRRLIGLYAFFYATLHLCVYIFLFSGYDIMAAWTGLRSGNPGALWTQFKLVWPGMVDDAEKRRFIQLGLFAWLLLLTLAVTSPQRVLRAMGGKNWQRVHRLIYVAAIAAVIHYWWLVKPHVTTPWKDTAVLALLFGARVIYVWHKRRRTLTPAPAGREYTKSA